MKIRIFATTVFCILTLSLFSQNSYDPVIGAWEGKLGISKTDSLTLVLAVERSGDSVTVEMDSPDQYAMKTPVSVFSFKNDTLVFKIPSSGISYKGILSRDENVITGNFKQGKQSLKLTLAAVAERQVINRPQEPKPPFPYQEEKLEIRNDKADFSITGTLTYPESDASLPLVILISGSGWEDRDCTVYGHKLFWVIADYLSRNGYAVFRYDDRPYTIFQQSNTFDFAADVNVIVDYFRKDPRINTTKIILAGHSEGSLIAFIAASKNPHIAGIISMAGAAETIDEALVYQLHDPSVVEKLPGDLLQQRISFNKEYYSILKKTKNQDVAIAKYKKLEAAWRDAGKETATAPEEHIGHMQLIRNNWWFTIFKIDPKDYIQKTRVPVYAFNGEKDRQVESSKNLSLMKQYLKKNTHCEIESFPELNHLFQESVTGSTKEYGKIEQTISPLVLVKILDWLNRQTR